MSKRSAETPFLRPGEETLFEGRPTGYPLGALASRMLCYVLLFGGFAPYAYLAVVELTNAQALPKYASYAPRVVVDVPTFSQRGPFLRSLRKHLKSQGIPWDERLPPE